MLARTRHGFIAGLGAWLFLTSPAAGHDDGKSGDSLPRYEGPGFTVDSGANAAVDFDSRGVELLSWVTLTQFDEPVGATIQRGNDIWGYVSPSGGEYAIIGLSQGVGFVDVTTPTNAKIIAGFDGPLTSWRDVKTFGHYAYVVADDSRSNHAKDITVYDLQQIDRGIVTEVNTVTTGRTHNVVIDTDHGFLYRTGNQDGDAKGLMIYDLNADPVNPPLIGQWSDRYIHDAQAYTPTEGPHSGKQIIFAFAENNAGGGSPGLDILDVTNKANIQLLGRVNYSNNRYAHQGWISPDGKYIYLDDELDETQDPDVVTTTTKIIDIRDLTNPVEAGTFTNGQRSIDHNLFTRDNLILESNYRSGLRVFDATNPLAPVEVGHFDTFPSNDNPSFNGLWGNYPYFPSGTVIGSDRENGLFVWTVNVDDARSWTPATEAGSWDDANNWSDQQSPKPDESVLIAPQQDTTVIGPGSDVNIYSLSLSPNSGGTPTLVLQPDVTLRVDNILTLEGNARLIGSGTITGRVLGATPDTHIEVSPNPAITIEDATDHDPASSPVSVSEAGANSGGINSGGTASGGAASGGGSLTMGDPGNTMGFHHFGTLAIGSGTVTLLDSDRARPGRVVTIEGGELIAANGVQLKTGDRLTGFGTIHAELRSEVGSTVELDGGDMILGDPDVDWALMRLEGDLIVGSNRATLVESDRVELNARTTQLKTGGVLESQTGITLSVDAEIRASGSSSIEGEFSNVGQVFGPTGTSGFLTFTDKVDGIGFYFGNIRFDGGFSPGGNLNTTQGSASGDLSFGDDDPGHIDPEHDPGDDPDAPDTHHDKDPDPEPDPDHGGAQGTGNAVIASMAVVTVNGNLELGSRGHLNIEITPIAYDKVEVSGMTSLDGTLEIDLIDGYIPAYGDAFEIISFGASEGDFTDVAGDVLLDDGKVALVPIVNQDTVTLVATGPGDIDANGIVDFNDFLILQNAFEEDGNWGDGDLDGNGVIDFQDFLILQNSFEDVYFTQTTIISPGLAQVGTTVVPEPATIVPLLGLLSLTLSPRSRWSRHRS